MLTLAANQVCPHSANCPHNRGVESCMGANPDRGNMFTCEFVDSSGKISESGFRNPQDQTGNQTILRG